MEKTKNESYQAVTITHKDKDGNIKYQEQAVMKNGNIN